MNISSTNTAKQTIRYSDEAAMLVQLLGLLRGAVGLEAQTQVVREQPAATARTESAPGGSAR